MATLKTGPRVLYYDIESAQNLVALFQLAHNDYVDPSNIVREKYIISVAWLWEGERTPSAVSVLDDPKRYARDPHDDRHVIEEFRKVLAQADVIIGHNGDRFDKRYLDTRILIHGFDPLPPIKSVDTLKIARNKFLFNSNKLDYLGRVLGVGRKLPTTHGLWMRVLNGDKSAIKEMVAYNKQDVLLLQRVYKKLLPYASNHPNLGLFGAIGCPKCGGKHVQSRGSYTSSTQLYQRWRCEDCTGWFKTSKAEKSTGVRFKPI